jgi:hypothetical protein
MRRVCKNEVNSPKNNSIVYTMWLNSEIGLRGSSGCPGRCLSLCGHMKARRLERPLQDGLGYPPVQVGRRPFSE